MTLEEVMAYYSSLDMDEEDYLARCEVETKKNSFKSEAE